MRLQPPRDQAAGERPLATAPVLATHALGGWNRRLNLQPGRALTAPALAIAQAHAERHLARLGARLSPGIVQGMELAVESAGEGGDRLVLAPGRGLAASGQDVVLRQPLALEVDALPRLGTDGQLRLPGEDGPARGPGVLLLLPITVVAERHASAAERERAFRDPCPDDADAVAFLDLRQEDGALLAFHPWPAEWEDHAAAGALRRNLLAFEVFAREALEGPGRHPLPWSAAGVALALVVIEADGRILLLDRHAVARKGGAAPPSRPLTTAAAEVRALFAGRGTPYLWQARLEQLLAQAVDLARAGRDLADARTHFRHLSPVGVLPKRAWGDGAGFFPPSWLRLSVPVPLEQLELALEPAAGLAPFDLEADDAVLWLVPVPQALYEPRLLQEEVVAQAFLDALQRLQVSLARALLQRKLLRAMTAVTAHSLDPALVVDIERSFADDTPLPGEDAIPPADPAGVRPPAAHDAKALARLRRFFAEELGQGLRALLAPAELASIDPGNSATTIANPAFAGIGPFTEGLASRLARAEDTVDLGFTRLQAEIYRIRQIMLDNEEATKLATSPVLAGVVKEASSALVASSAVKSYFTATRQVRPTPAAVPTSALVPAASAFALLRQPAPAPVQPALDLGRIVRETTKETVGRFVALDPALTRASIGQRLSIPGELRDFRTLTVADRLKVSAATEAKSGAVRLKADIVAEVQGLGLHLAGLPTPILPRGHALLAGQDFQHLREKLRAILAQFDLPEQAETLLMIRARQITGKSQGDDDALHLVDLRPLRPDEVQILRGQAGIVREVEAFFADVHGGGGDALALPALPGLILAGVFDPDPQDGDEASFLSQAIATLEGTVGLLRVVEGRIEAGKRLLDLARRVRADLVLIHDAWREDLAEADRQLAERRHDLAVGESLLAEETRRVDGINARRRETLARHVPFVAYMRPRTASAQAGTRLPVRDALALEAVDAPACAEGGEPPADLAELLGVLREAPLAWLVDLAPLVARLDRPSLLAKIYGTAVLRARLLQAEAPEAARPGTTTAPLAAEAAKSLAHAYGRTVLAFAKARATLDPQLVSKLGAKEARARAARELCLADLEASGRLAPRDLEEALAALARIQDVAGCLVRRAGEVPVGVRLAWVQRLSVFDPAIDLAHPERLPGWASVPFPLARELMRLVHWLFARVDPAEAEARALMSDVARVAILLASHAPAAALVAGRVATVQRAGKGDLVEIALDAEPPRLGGRVRVLDAGGLRLEGVVEDVASGKAFVRVLEASSLQFELSTRATAQFLAPAAAPRR